MIDEANIFTFVTIKRVRARESTMLGKTPQARQGFFKRARH